MQMIGRAKKRWRAIGILAAAATLIGTRPTCVLAAPQTACAILPLAEVRAIVAAPVDVSQLGSFGPRVKEDQTFSNCTYILPKVSRGAKVTLVWAPAAELTSTHNFYMKRNQEQPRIKGDVLVLASVWNADAIDVSASRKLVDAVAKNLR